MRYIELNPVRAGMVPEAAHYSGSSFGQRVGLDAIPGSTPIPATSGWEIPTRYADEPTNAFCATRFQPANGLFRESLQRGQLTGNQRFVDEVARIAGRRVGFREQGGCSGVVPSGKRRGTRGYRRGIRGWSGAGSCGDSFRGVGSGERPPGWFPVFQQGGCPEGRSQCSRRRRVPTAS